MKGDKSDPLPHHPGGRQPWLHFTSALLTLLLATPKGPVPGGRDRSQGPFPDLPAEELLLTQEAAGRHPGLRTAAVPALVTEVSHLGDSCAGQKPLLARGGGSLVPYRSVQPWD